MNRDRVHVELEGRRVPLPSGATVLQLIQQEGLHDQNNDDPIVLASINGRRTSLAEILRNLALVELKDGNNEAAKKYCNECLELARTGVAFMARQAKALIMPVGNASRRALHINRWDQYWLPLPFDRIYTSAVKRS